LTDEEILWFDIPVEDSPTMTKRESPQELKEEEFDIPWVETSGVFLHVLGQIRVLMGNRNE